MEAITKILVCMYLSHIIGADVTITIQKEAAEPPIQNATIGPSSNGTEYPFLITEPSENESDGTATKSPSINISTTEKSTPVELLDMDAYVKPFETNSTPEIIDIAAKNITEKDTTKGSEDSSNITGSQTNNDTTPSLFDTISTIIVETINKKEAEHTKDLTNSTPNKAQNSSEDSSNGTSSSTVSPSSSTTLVINFNVTEAVSASPEDTLIPPADVNASIAQIDTKHSTKGQIIISSQPDCPSLVDADSLSQTTLLQRLTHGCRYDRLERPLTLNEKGERLPVNVSARAYIYFLQNLEAHDLQFKIHALLQLRFVDPRLVFKEVAPKRRQPILGENSLREALWVPHIFLANERDSSILGTAEKDVLTSISPDGTVIISTRIQSTLYCWMNLQKFPFDEQHCSTVLESWMYNTSELVLHWENKSPVTLAPELHLTEYVLLNTWTNESVINADLSDLRHGAFAGNYSSLSFTVHLAREMGFYLMDYFLPSMMIVAISWVSFWLQADQSAPRIMLGTSTMLTFITLASAQGKTLPKVSYIKVSEVWFLGCTGFIFGSLVEFAFVNTIWRRKKNVELKKVNSKYILKSTLTPRPARKEMGLHKSRSCSSLNGTCSESNSAPYNNYLTVHSFPSKTNLPTITTQSVDDLSHENGSLHINMEPSSSITTLPMNKMSTSSSMGQSGNNSNYGWTTMTPQEISMWIDRRSRFIFPCAFVIFNAFFWTFVYYL